MVYPLSADLSEHVTFVYPTTQFIPPPSRALALQVVNRIPKSTKCTTSKCTAVDVQCATTISPACLIELYNISTMPANSLGVSTFDNELANKDDLAVHAHMTRCWRARPVITNGTFAVQSQ